MEVLLETDRLVLRRFTFDDADLLVDLDSDPLVRRFVEDGDSVNREQALRTIGLWIAEYENSDLFGFWAAIEKSSGTFLGWFHFRPGQHGALNVPELGFRLIHTAWGKGYATEGSRALIDNGFATSEITLVVAETMAIHVASRRVMVKAGMTLLRTFRADWPVRIPGDEHGDVEYGISRIEWAAATKGRAEFGCTSPGVRLTIASCPVPQSKS